jgi:hypothetical protein
MSGATMRPSRSACTECPLLCDPGVTPRGIATVIEASSLQFQAANGAGDTP